MNLTDGARVKVSSSEGSNWAVYDSSYKKSRVESGSSLEMVSDFGAFCYSRLSDQMAECDVLVNSEATSDNAVEWDEETNLSNYRYVKFTAPEGGRSRASGKVYILGRNISDGELPASVPHSGKIEYDSASDTLTLTNAVIDLDKFDNGSAGNLVAGIYSLSDLRIVLHGSNKIISSKNLYGSGTEYVSGIEGWYTVGFTGTKNDSLSIELAGNNSKNSNIEFCGISSDEGLTADYVSLTVSMGKYGDCTGIYAWAPIILNKGAFVSVRADGSSSKAVNGVNSIGKTEINGDSILEMASDGIAFNCWTPGASLKAADAQVSMKKNGSGAAAWDKVSALYDYKYVCFSGADESGGRFGDDVRILGRKVDETNCNDVLGDGTVKFDIENDILTLTNANLDLKNFHHEYDDDPNPDSGCNYAVGILADRSISVVLNGKNRIFSSVSQYDAKKQHVYGVKSGVTADISFSRSGATGSLEITLTKDNEALTYCGMDIGSDLTVDNAAITVDLGGTLKGTGIDAGIDDFTLKNGASLKVKALGGGSTGVYYVMASGMSIDESSLFEMTADGKAFNCWMISNEVKERGALVNEAASAEGAQAWDKKTLLDTYKYVRFPEVYSHDHQIKHVKAKAATCTEAGYEEYWICTSCSTMFSDASGTDDKIIEKPTVIPAKGHNYGDWESISDKEHQRVCANDESHKETAEHTWDSGKITKPATLLRKGEKVYTCTTCSATRTEEYSYKETVKEKVKETAEKVKEWLKKIFGDDEIPDGAAADILEVKLSETSFTYNGKVQKPEVLSVSAGDYEIVPGDYAVKYSDDKSCDAGTYKVTVTALDAEGFDISGEAEYTIVKAENSLEVIGLTASLEHKILKFKSQKLSRDDVMLVSDTQGKVTYSKLKGNKKITINSKTGNVTVKKGLKKGTYRVTVRVKADGGNNYESASVKATFTVKVR
jgi:methionine-rich copper-binding protein CopC